jgi:hypothetical protein
LPAGFLSNRYIMPDSPQIIFSIEDNKGKKQTAKVILGTRHPSYRENYHLERFPSPRNDIALLLLDHEFKNIAPVTIDFSIPKDEENCISVGYSSVYVTPLQKDKRVPIFYDRQSVKIATKLPSLPYEPQAELHMSTLGYRSSIIEDTWCCCLNVTYANFDIQKPNKEPFEIGVPHGMGGGGYFNSHSLLGINVFTVYPSGYKKGYSSQFLDRVFFLPLSTNRGWLEETLAFFEKKLPILDRKIDLIDEKGISRIQNKEDKYIPVSKEEIILKITHKFSTFLIAFQKKHLTSKDKILNEKIDTFLKSEYLSLFDSVSDIKNTLLSKGHSVNNKQSTLFKSNDNAIADIQKIIDIANDLIKKIHKKPTVAMSPL